jgi:hypothetical protein
LYAKLYFFLMKHVPNQVLKKCKASSTNSDAGVAAIDEEGGQGGGLLARNKKVRREKSSR